MLSLMCVSSPLMIMQNPTSTESTTGVVVTTLRWEVVIQACVILNLLGVQIILDGLSQSLFNN